MRHIKQSLQNVQVSVGSTITLAGQIITIESGVGNPSSVPKNATAERARLKTDIKAIIDELARIHGLI